MLEQSIHQEQDKQAESMDASQLKESMQRREKARSKVMNALKKAGATPSTIRQVSQAMERRTMPPVSIDFADSLPPLDQPPSWRGKEEVRMVGLGCTLEMDINGFYWISSVLPGGTCVLGGVEEGSTLLSIDGVPIRNMPLHDIRLLSSGPAGSSVTLRYRPPGRDPNHPASEKTVTRREFQRLSALGMLGQREDGREAKHSSSPESSWMQRMLKNLFGSKEAVASARATFPQRRRGEGDEWAERMSSYLWRGSAGQSTSDKIVNLVSHSNNVQTQEKLYQPLLSDRLSLNERM